MTPPAPIVIVPILENVFGVAVGALSTLITVEAVAFVVCQAIGLDTNTAAADYIKLYNGDKTILSNSLQFIQSTAIDMLTALGVDRDPAPGGEA